MRNRLVASPCSNPKLGLEEALTAYAGAGYGKFEAFTGWADSSLDYTADPALYLATAEKHHMRFTSMHLPRINPDDQASLDQAITATRFAQAMGIGIVIYKAADRPTYIKAAKDYLDGIAGTGVTPVLQNHFGTPITTLDDYRKVIEGINDPRMKTLLEVGHFEKAGIPWQQGHELLKGSIALVHIKDMKDRKPVPFGTGTVDFSELFGTMDADGYEGDYVVEMEVCIDDNERTISLMKEAGDYLTSLAEVKS